MGSAFHQLCPRYSETLIPTAPTAIRLWDTFTFYDRAWTKNFIENLQMYILLSVFFSLKVSSYNFDKRLICYPSGPSSSKLCC